MLALLSGSHVQSRFTDAFAKRSSDIQPIMSAQAWFAQGHTELPLVHLPISKMLLPGESRTLVVEHAESLAALDAATDSCVGCLLTTPPGNALSTTVLLEVRDVRRKDDVGALVDVCAAGRCGISSIEQGRHYRAMGVWPVRDGIAVTPTEAAIMPSMGDAEEARPGSGSREQLAKFRVALVNTRLRQRTVALFKALCEENLDAAPATSIERLHDFWGVEDEPTALAQLESFAACEHLSAVQRSLALEMRDTRERREYAKRCGAKVSKRAAAHLAVQEALAATDV